MQNPNQSSQISAMIFPNIAEGLINRIGQVAAEIKEEAGERAAYDLDAGIIPDMETADMLSDWAERLERECFMLQTPHEPLWIGIDLSNGPDIGAYAAVKVNQDHVDLVGHLRRQREFSLKTFGPGMRTDGVVNHICDELIEVLQNPLDVVEWVDIVLLALDGALRTGAAPKQIAEALLAKQSINENRSWPDWRNVPECQPIEHLKPESE